MALALAAWSALWAWQRPFREHLSDRYQVPGARWRGNHDETERLMVAMGVNSDPGDSWEWAVVQADDPHYDEKFSALEFALAWTTRCMGCRIEIMAPMTGFPEFLPLPNAVIDMGTSTALKENGQPLRIYFHGPTDQLKSMTVGNLLLDPGMSPHPPHRHPEEEFMLIAQGAGEILVDGQACQVGPGSMMYCAGNRMHGITNTGTEKMLFYFWKWLA